MNMQTNVNRGGYRVPLYDNLKAVGIILVVLGHVTVNHGFGKFIYSFHMPLFFFISGMLYKPKERYALKLARSLLWPYLVFAVLSFLYWAVLEVRFRPIPDGTGRVEQFVGIFWPVPQGEQAYLMNIVLWFLPALYLCSNAYHYALRRIDSAKGRLAVVALLVVMLQFAELSLPLCIPQALCALPFFALGHIVKDKPRPYINAGKGVKASALIFAVLLFVSVYMWSPGGDMRVLTFPYGYTAYFVVASFCIVSLCLLCPSGTYKPLSVLGRGSLFIMLTHEPLKRIVIKLYSVAVSSDVDCVRESISHSLIITAILILILYPVSIFVHKHCVRLLRI